MIEILIQLLIVALVIWLVFWVLDRMGLPPVPQRIISAVFGLILILWVLRKFLGIDL